MEKSELNKIDIEKIAALSMLSFTEKEMSELKSELAEIIEFASNVNGLEIEEKENIKPENIFREDVASKDSIADEILSCVKTKHERYITVVKAL